VSAEIDGISFFPTLLAGWRRGQAGIARIPLLEFQAMTACADRKLEGRPAEAGLGVELFDLSRDVEEAERHCRRATPR